ncbi:MAG: PAC2 family protein [Candidatus Methanomethylophilaceae archaeon]|nr:PAC2 family protein [Candidatus Methanomethylophilaceae archaeon]
MSELELHVYDDKTDLSKSVAIIGFPSLGLVSSIAASYMSKELKLNLVAGITSQEFPPYTIIQNSKPMPQIRMYAGCRKDKAEGGMEECDDIVVITSEFVPKDGMNYKVSELLITWLKDNGIKTVLVLDGIPLFGEDNYILLGAGSTDSARVQMNEYGIESFEEGMVRGMTALLLMEGAERNVDVIAMLGSAKADVPDPKGAAKIMEFLAKMLPELKIDTAPLFKEADELEKRIASQQIPETTSSMGDRVLYR